jgi:hypothetical protein
MAYAYVGSRKAPRGRSYVDVSPFRGPFVAPTLDFSGLGATTTSVTEQECNAFKNCANPKLIAAGFKAVPQGPLGPLTCAAAYNSAGNGCAYQAQIKAACNQQNLVGTPLPRLQEELRSVDPVSTDYNISRTLEIATIMAQDTARKMEESNMTSSAYPWNTYAAKTLELQKRANAAAYEAWKAGGYVGCYCKIKEDGILGNGSCGAIRNTGIPVPPSCKSFATECKGEMVCATGTTPTPTATPPAVVQVTPSSGGSVQPAPKPVTPTTAAALPNTWTASSMLVGGIVAAAVAVGGYAAYTVGKKKGWFK